MKTSSPTPKVEKVKMRNMGMKSRLPETTFLIPYSTSPKLTLYILIVRKSLLWKIWSAQFLVFKICIRVFLEHKPEEVCLRELHLFLKRLLGSKAWPCRDPCAHQPHPAEPLPQGSQLGHWGSQCSVATRQAN